MNVLLFAIESPTIIILVVAAIFLLFGGSKLPQLAKALPSTWYADVVRWLPGGDVINEISSTAPGQISSHLFSAWGEFAVFGGYTVVVLAVGAVLFVRRDA